MKEAIIAQLVQQKAQEVVTGLRNAAKIEVVDPELKKVDGGRVAMGEAAPAALRSPPDLKSSAGAPQPEDKSSADAPDKP